MYIVNSLLVILFLISITIAFCFYLFSSNIWRHLKVGSQFSRVLLVVLAGTMVFLAYMGLWQYTNPFEQTLELKLVATIKIPPAHTLHGPQNLPWHAVYESYGILYPESIYFINIEEESHLGFSWPDMDFENYTYIISYGQKIQSLSYNVWETIDVPFHTGAKAGHAVLSNQFVANEVYVYQIKKMRIDNGS